MYDVSCQGFRQRLKKLNFPNSELLVALRKDLLASPDKNNEISSVNSSSITSRDFASSRSSGYDLPDVAKLKQSILGYQNQLQLLSADLASEELKNKVLDDCIVKYRSGHKSDHFQLKENDIAARISQLEAKIVNNVNQYNINTSRLTEKQMLLDELRTRNLKIIEQSQQITKNSTPKSSTDNFLQMYKEKLEGMVIQSNDPKDESAVKQDLAAIAKIIETQKLIILHQPDNQLSQKDFVRAKVDEFQEKINKTVELLRVNALEDIFTEAERLQSDNNSLFQTIFETNEQKKKLQDEVNALEVKLDEREAKFGDIPVNYQDEKMYSEVYKEIDDIFNMLGCSWDVSPDEKARCTSVNAMFALSSIETSLNAICEELKKKPAPSKNKND